LNKAKQKAEELRCAVPHKVFEWEAYKAEIRELRKRPGVYMFSKNGKPMYVGCATGAGGLEARLRQHVHPKSLGKPWNAENPPPKNVRGARNLLTHVLRDLFSQDEKSIKHLDEPDEQGSWWTPENVCRLNRGFEEIRKMTVQWAVAECWDTATRAEHCAMCLLQPEWVARHSGGGAK